MEFVDCCHPSVQTSYSFSFFDLLVELGMLKYRIYLNRSRIPYCSCVYVVDLEEKIMTKAALKFNSTTDTSLGGCGYDHKWLFDCMLIWIWARNRQQMVYMYRNVTTYFSSNQSFHVVIPTLVSMSPAEINKAALD